MRNRKVEIRNVEMKKCEALIRCRFRRWWALIADLDLGILLHVDHCLTLKMCDKKIKGPIEVIDLTLYGTSDEEENPVRNSTASTVVIFVRPPGLLSFRVRGAIPPDFVHDVASKVMNYYFSRLQLTYVGLKRK